MLQPNRSDVLVLQVSCNERVSGSGFAGDREGCRVLQQALPYFRCPYLPGAALVPRSHHLHCSHVCAWVCVCFEVVLPPPPPEAGALKGEKGMPLDRQMLQRGFQMPLVGPAACQASLALPGPDLPGLFLPSAVLIWKVLRAHSFWLTVRLMELCCICIPRGLFFSPLPRPPVSFEVRSVLNCPPWNCHFCRAPQFGVARKTSRQEEPLPGLSQYLSGGHSRSGALQPVHLQSFHSRVGGGERGWHHLGTQRPWLPLCLSLGCLWLPASLFPGLFLTQLFFPGKLACSWFPGRRAQEARLLPRRQSSWLPSLTRGPKNNQKPK